MSLDLILLNGLLPNHFHLSKYSKATENSNLRIQVHSPISGHIFIIIKSIFIKLYLFS